MTQASHYTRTTGFADDERNNAGGRSTVVTADVDAELDTVSSSLNLTIDNLAIIQRDDGVMRDGIVPVTALGADTLKMLTATGVPRGAWVTATAYAIKDLVTQSSNTYICVTAHTSGTFATDLAALKWILFQIGANPAASAIPFSPTVNVTSSNLQAALVEVDTNARTRDTAIYSDFADVANPAKNSGLIGFTYALNYAAGTIGAWLRGLAGSVGASLIGFIQALAGALGITVQTKLRSAPVNPVEWGADPTGVADSAAAIEACVNSGATSILYGQGATFKLSRPINCHVSGVTHDMRGASLTVTATNTGAFVVGYNGAAFVKTDDTTFIGGKIVGADNGLTTTVGFGISVQPPTVVPYASGSGCSGLKIIDTWIDNFCGSVAATGADTITIDGLRATNMQYHAAASAGGYGVLLQSCFNAKITERCKFIGGTNSRHAIYVSADPGRAFDANNVCYDVSIGACMIDWTAVTGTTGFETGIFARGAFNLSVIGTQIKGAFGGFTYDLQNAAGSNITIQGLNVTNMRTGAGQLAAVSFTRSAGTNRATNVSVQNITASLAGANAIGVQLAYIDGVVSGGHNISCPTGSYVYGVYTVDCTDQLHTSSRISGSKNTAMYWTQVSVANSNVQVDRQQISGSGTAFGYSTVPTALRFTYPRTFQVSSNGSGTVTVTNDEYPVGVSVVSDANGFAVTVAPEIITGPMNFSVLAESSSIANVYHRTTAGQAITFGVLNGSLSPLPAATNAYTVAVTALH